MSTIIRFIRFLSALFICFNLFSADFLIKDKFEDINYYHDAISSINLMNGLHLTDQQLKKLLKLNQKIDALDRQYLRATKLQNLKEKDKKALKKLYNFLTNNPEQENKSIQDNAHQAHERFKKYKLKRAEYLKEDINKISSKAKQLLTSHQLSVINTFTPCIVPPQDLRDPVKAGQAQQENQKALNILNRIRKIKYPKHLDAAASKIANKIIDLTNTYYFKMTAQEITARRQEIIKQIEYAYSLDDTQYELKKHDILKRILPPKDKLVKLYESVNARNPHTASLGSLQNKKLIKYLLNPKIMIPILEKWLKANKTGGLRN